MDLYSEQDVLTKVVVPDLAALGYQEGKTRNGLVVFRFQRPIDARQGRERRTIFADLVVFVDDLPVIVVDAKNPRHKLTDDDREQVVSYARLLDNIAPYAALCNGHWQVFDTVRKQEIKALPPLRQLLSDLAHRRLTDSQRSNLRFQANRTLFAIETVRDLSRLMKRCHDTIRNLQGYDPTRAFDELSKILFTKMYEERELADGNRGNNRFTIGSVREMRKQGVEIIQQLWKDTVTSDRYREVFSDESASQSIALPPEAIDRIVEMLEDKSLGLTDMDVKGIAFEEFLSATYRGGGLGQYFTPRQVVNFMVELVDPTIGDKTIDPSCGSGGFLIRVYDVISEKIRASEFSEREKARLLSELANQNLVGIDWEQRAARTCKMNMILHGDGHAGVYQANALDVNEVTAKVVERQRFYPNAPSIEEGTFDLVLTNPPFGAWDNTEAILRHYNLGHGGRQKREVLLLERHIRLLRRGGRLFVVIPEGILSNRNDSLIRRYILDNCIIRAVIRLPQDTFKMSGGAACTSLLYAVKKVHGNEALREQGDIFFARAEYVGIAPSGVPISENDLLAIREQYRKFAAGEWDGIEMEPTTDGGMRFIRSEPTSDSPWIEPAVNRTSMLYDRLTYVIRKPQILDRFSYTYFHPTYYRVMQALEQMGRQVVSLVDLCVDGYPVRGRKPSEESTEGIAVLKVRNITGRSIDLDTEYAPDTETIRTANRKALVQRDDLLVTSTGEGTIGRVDLYPYDDPAIADGHIAIVRLSDTVNPRYILEFLRSEYGQVQMLRHVSGSTGQTELLIEHVRSIKVPLPNLNIQEQVVKRMAKVRAEAEQLRFEAKKLEDKSANMIALGRREMINLVSYNEEEAATAGPTRDDFFSVLRRIKKTPVSYRPDE